MRLEEQLGSELVEQLRNKGAIIYAKAVCTEYNGRAGDPGGRHEPAAVLPMAQRYFLF